MKRSRRKKQDTGYDFSPTTVGLDIGTTAIKVVEMAHDGDEPEVIRLGLRHLLWPDEGDVIELLHDLWETEGFGRRDVVCAVDQAAMFVLEAEDYAFDGSDFGSWVERTMGSKLPAAQGRAAVDWQALGGCAAEGRVLAVGVDAQRVNARVQLLKMADLEATILDARALALTNALLWNHPEAREGCVGLIEVGGNSAAILILDDGIPVLAQSFDMPPLPRHPPYGLSSEEMWAHSIELLRSFEQCLSLDRARIPVDGVETPQVGQIFVAGGGFLIPGLLETLAEVMQWVVRRAHPFERIPVAPGGSGQIAMEDEHLMFMQAMGLALRRS